MLGRIALAASLVLAPALAGCLDLAPDALDPDAAALAPRDVLAGLDFVAYEDWSRTLVPGTLARLPVEVVDVTSFDGTPINLGLFRPDTTEKVPVIIDSGPYYADGDEPADSDQTHRLGGFLIENFVPHGYAVVQMSVRGTGNSGGCGDFFGAAELADIDAVAEWAGTAAWSNGNVAFIGRSYDGSTAFLAAATGNEHVKTIVPISGIPSMRDLYYRNGSSELRAPILGAFYWSDLATDNAGPSPNPRFASPGCADVAQHVAFGTEGWLDGGATPAGETPYWSQRDYKPEILENYEGSVFLVHGLQDWNVHPDVVIPFYNALTVEKKALLGQWGHMYPDRPDEHEHLRWDWAEMLLRWFDRYLKGADVDPGLYMEVEDSTNHWRIDPQNAFPMPDQSWLSLHPNADGSLAGEPGEPGTTTISTIGAPGTVPSVQLTSAPLEADTLVTGLPQLHLTVMAEGAGGSLYARLYDLAPGGDRVQIGRAQMDLRYAAGGYEPQPVVPMQEMVARMEFYPMNARVLAGHSLLLVIENEGRENLPSPTPFPVMVHLGEASVLRLPVVERAFEENRWDNADAENLADGF